MATMLGGFFSTLKLTTDAASFDKGVKSLNNITKSTKTLKSDFGSMSKEIVSMVMKMGAAFLGLTAVLGKLGEAGAASMGKLATGAARSGMAANNFKAFTDAADVAGVGADSMAKALDALSDAATNLPLGNAEAMKSMSENFSSAGLGNFLAILREEPNKRAYDVIEALSKAPNKMTAFTALRNANLSGIADSFQNMLAKGGNLFDVIEKMKQLQFFTPESLAAGAQADTSFKTAGKGLESAGTEIMNQIGIALKPLADEVIKYLIDHKEEIRQLGKDIGDALRQVVEGLREFAKNIGPVIQQIGTFLFGGNKNTVEGQHTAGILDNLTDKNATATKNIVSETLMAQIAQPNVSKFMLSNPSLVEKMGLPKGSTEFSITDLQKKTFQILEKNLSLQALKPYDIQQTIMEAQDKTNRGPFKRTAAFDAFKIMGNELQGEQLKVFEDALKKSVLSGAFDPADLSGLSKSVINDILGPDVATSNTNAQTQEITLVFNLPTGKETLKGKIVNGQFTVTSSSLAAVKDVSSNK